MSDVRIYVALTSDCGTSAMKMLNPLRGLPVGVNIGLELFVKEGPSIVKEIKEIDIENMRPIDALNRLSAIKERINGDQGH